MNRPLRLELITPDASAEEAAAVIAAVERFMRDTAPVPVATPLMQASRWQQAGLEQALRRPLEPAASWE